MSVNSRFIMIAGVFGLLGVASGAFGAHALKEMLTPDLLAIFKTGSTYCLQHAIVLLVVSLYQQQAQNQWLHRACWSFTIGICIFSGSLWALALTNTRWLGAITPCGGLALLSGWSCIVLYTRQRVQEDCDDDSNQ